MSRCRSFCLAAVVFVLAGLLAGCGGDEAGESYSDDMAEQHEGDTPEATAAAREPMIPVTTTTVAYATTDAGEAVTGYMATPENPDSVLTARGMNPETDSLPAVVVIHEWWGLNENIRAATRRIAGEGYRALAVDLYDGSTAETPDAARALMQQAMKTPDRLADNIASANTYLKREAGAPRTAIMGWCFGGSMTLTGAVTQPNGYSGAVVYYGRVADLTQEELAPISFPVVGFFGGEDGSIPVESVRAFETKMTDAGNDVDIYIYDDAGHAFANPSGTSYNPDAAADAWDKTTAFLQEQLYGSTEAESASAE
jgi:carboxymethylenebutenolidase